MADPLRLTAPALAVLRALAEHHPEPVHGKALAAATGLKSGTLYPLLERLERHGAAVSAWETDGQAERRQAGPGRPRRRYYTLTPAGRALLDAHGSREPAGSRGAVKPLRDETAAVERQLAVLADDLQRHLNATGQQADTLARMIHETANAAYNQGVSAAALGREHSADEIHASVRRVAAQNPGLFPALAMLDRNDTRLGGPA